MNLTLKHIAKVNEDLIQTYADRVKSLRSAGYTEYHHQLLKKHLDECISKLEGIQLLPIVTFTSKAYRCIEKAKQRLGLIYAVERDYFPFHFDSDGVLLHLPPTVVEISGCSNLPKHCRICGNDDYDDFLNCHECTQFDWVDSQPSNEQSLDVDIRHCETAFLSASGVSS